MRADLHIHSTVSDGSVPIDDIIRIAFSKGLDFIAITDHDTVSHIARFPKNPPVKMFGGIEISAVSGTSRQRAHILGYNLKTYGAVLSLTRPLLEARNRNSERQAEILIKQGYSIDFDKINRADGKYLYKQHIMDWLVSTGQIPELFGGFYYKTFKNGGICDFDIEYIDAADAVRAIKICGGQAVLAHPGQQKNFHLIPELVRDGLDGLELNHHANSSGDKLLIWRYAHEYNLFLTGGSDFHGKYEPQTYSIGDFTSDNSGVEAVCGI
jgi:Predicted metal-dependent phosphoesterases (PHP family)